MALPIVLLLFFGMADVGLALKTYSSAASAVRAGGRTASVAGSDPLADAFVLERLADSARGLINGGIDLVVIWHATGPGDPVPAACLPAMGGAPNTTSLGVSDGGTDLVGACNVYQSPDAPGGAFDMAQGNLVLPPSYYFGCQGESDPLAGQKVDCRWPGQNRRVIGTPRTPSGAGRPPDFVGVYLRIDYHVLTGHLGSSLTIEDSSIHLIEPRGYDLT